MPNNRRYLKCNCLSHFKEKYNRYNNLYNYLIYNEGILSNEDKNLINSLSDNMKHVQIHIYEWKSWKYSLYILAFEENNIHIHRSKCALKKRTNIKLKDKFSPSYGIKI